MKYAVLFLLLLCGCSPTWIEPAQAPYADNMYGHKHVCLDIPSEQLSAAHAAVDAWDRALHQIWHVESIDHGRPEFDACDVWVHVVDHELMRPLTAARVNDIGGHEIELRRGWYEQDTSGFLMHELGHAFGAQHMPWGLMQSTWARHLFICPDLHAVSQVAAWNHLPLDQFAWCDP